MGNVAFIILNDCLNKLPAGSHVVLLQPLLLVLVKYWRGLSAWCRLWVVRACWCLLCHLLTVIVRLLEPAG